MSNVPPIQDLMTRSPHSVGVTQSLAVAHLLMRQHGIRHLPVLNGGQLVGMVSQRDLHLLETLPDVDTHKVPVEDAMSAEVYCVAPDTPLTEVARHMAEHRLGSAVIMEGSKVAGVFTTVDALRALATLLEEQSLRPERSRQ